MNFTWHDDACRLLMDQAAMYAGRVTAFHVTLAEHTAANGTARQSDQEPDPVPPPWARLYASFSH